MTDAGELQVEGGGEPASGDRAGLLPPGGEPAPVCGRASREFSIFTATAGWGATFPLGTPVSGHTTGAGAEAIPE